MAANKIRARVTSSFKLSGLSLRSDASKLVVEVLSELQENDVDKWLDRIIDAVQKQPLSDAFIDKDIVETAINECNQGGAEEGDKVFNIINAFEVPRFIYHKERKKFVLNESGKAHLHGDAEDKCNMFKERYDILLQRALHHDLFTPAALASSTHEKGTKFALKPVEHLLGCSGSLGNVIVLGMLTQLKEGKYFLEDPSGAVEMDLSKTVFHTGLFTENCFVLAEGSYEDQVFHVTALGFPPTETAKTTRSYYGNVNFFGGPSTICVANSDKLKLIEQDNQDAMFVIISDIWLDQPQVMQKLKTLFSGYSEMPPTVFILCGNFLSQPHGASHASKLKKGLLELASIIKLFPPLLENSRFIMIPGPQDPGPGNILPRPPISRLLIEEFIQAVPFAEFTTNPCRIQYCTQEILIFREDIVNKMCRNCVHLPGDMENVSNHFVKTMLSQAHLCPLPLHVRPIYWSFDAALRIYPVPDLVVCADKFDAYNVNHSDTTCVNPGSFSRSGFGFKVYWPSTREVEDCKIND